jgi:hypothetical protein
MKSTVVFQEGKRIEVIKMMSGRSTLGEWLWGSMEDDCRRLLYDMTGGGVMYGDMVVSLFPPKMDDEWYLDVEGDCIVQVDMFVFGDEESFENFRGCEVPIFIKNK